MPSDNRKVFGHRKVSSVKIASFSRNLMRWWRRGQRNFPWRSSSASLYHQIVSEVLLQRTRADTVSAFWPNFIERFPSWTSIASSSLEELEQTLKPIGLSKQRAPRLYALAQLMVASNGQFSSLREHVEELPGVGQYIANAILMFAHGRSEPLMDTNMARVLERFFGARKLSDIRDDPFLQTLAREVLKTGPGKNINWAILDFAALLCKSGSPLCDDCPMQIECSFAKRVSRRRPP